MDAVLKSEKADGWRRAQYVVDVECCLDGVLPVIGLYYIKLITQLSRTPDSQAVFDFALRMCVNDFAKQVGFQC